MSFIFIILYNTLYLTYGVWQDKSQDHDVWGLKDIGDI
jgi:hypothetical protein